MDYVYRKHSKSRLRYHIVLVSKYRRKCFVGVEDVVLDAFRVVESRSDFSIVALGVEGGDHVHLVVKCAPDYSVGQVVSRLKQLTHSFLWERIGDHLQDFYWGKKRVWSSGYYVATVGAVSDKKVLEYIQKQCHSSTNLKS